MSLGKFSCVVLIVLFAGVACHKRSPASAPAKTTPAASTATARPAAPPPAPAPAATPAPAPLTEAELFQQKSLDDLNREHPLDDVFFDYDQNTLREDGKHALDQDARWLAKWPTTAVRIDGHCDERGSAEYNLALGDRRATAVRAYLVGLGVKADRIQLRSLGKEAPFCNGSEESCWSQNRRGHFWITAK